MTIYPYDNEEQTEEEQHANNTIRRIIPFAVVGSESEINLDGKVTRGRKTRWGAIDIENPAHCEFVYLRDFLTRTHLQDMIETTALVHYEAFRTKQLVALKENAAQAGKR